MSSDPADRTSQEDARAQSRLPFEVFRADISDVRPMVNLLRCVSFSSRAVLMISTSGIKFTVQVGKTAQAHAYLLSRLFTSYLYTPALPPTLSSSQLSQSQTTFDLSAAHEDIEINLHTLLECLNIFGATSSSGGGTGEWKGRRTGWGSDDEDEGEGSRKRWRDRESGEERSLKNTSLRISYRGEGHPFTLILEEGGVVARCELTTYEAEPDLDLSFTHDSHDFMAIMKSEYLSDALSSLDPSATSLAITFSIPSSSSSSSAFTSTSGHRTPSHARPSKRRRTIGVGSNVIRLEAKGTLGSSATEFTDDKDVVEHFEGRSEGKSRYLYKFSIIGNVKKALQVSQKTSIRVDSEGLLSMQFQTPVIPSINGKKNSDEQHGYVEFICLPLLEDED